MRTKEQEAERQRQWRKTPGGILSYQRQRKRRSTYEKSWRIRNREHVALKHVEYVASNRVKILERMKLWRQRNKRHLAEYYKNYRREHPVRRDRREYKKAYEAAHAPERRERRKRWAFHNAERLRALKASYYQRHKERIKAKSRARYNVKKLEILAKNKIYRQSHRLQMNAYSLKHKRKNIETIRRKAREYARIRYIKNADKIKAMARQQTALRRRCLQLSSALEREKIKNLILKAKKDPGLKCVYCGNTIAGKFELDHIVPLSRFGKHEASNIAFSCKSCNSSKNNKPLDEWLKEREN